MDNTLVVKTEPKIDGLTVRALRVMKYVQKELGDRSDHINYGIIARALGLEWNHVKHAVQKLVKVGVLDVSEGKMTVIKRIVL